MMKKQIKKADFLKLPNLISYSRILIAFYVILNIFFEISSFSIQVLYLYAALSDKLDGFTARSFKMITYLGSQILEPIADGLLIISGLCYLIFKADLPTGFIIGAFIILVFSFLSSFLYFLKTKKIYDIHNISARLAVLVSHILIVYYIFQIPGKEIAAFVALMAGMILFFDYLLKLYKAAVYK